MEEVAKGRISAPVRWHDSNQGLPVCRRFGVAQLSSSGRLKLRVIDDFAEDGVNDATSVRRRIRMGSLRDLRGCARRLRARFPGVPLRLFKADFKSAYRAIPILPDDLVFARVLLVSPFDGELYVATQLAMPFGAVGAVYAWDGLAAAVCGILAELFHVPVIRYVDDLFLVVPSGLDLVAHRCVHPCVRLLGLTLDLPKSPLPSDKGVLLGVSVAFLGDEVIFEGEPAKVRFWLSQLEESAAGSPAAIRGLPKLVGRLSFGCWAVWGQGAAAYLAPLYRAIRSGRIDLSSLEGPISWWVRLLSKEVWGPVTFRLSPASLGPALLGAGLAAWALSLAKLCVWSLRLVWLQPGLGVAAWALSLAKLCA